MAIRLDALPYNHPPFEAVFFVPFAYLSYTSAFAAWTLANLAILISLPFMLRPQLLHLQNYSLVFWLVASLGFFPIFFALLQGQDAILLLFLYALAFVCLKKNRDVAAGGWLAFGLFKPHLILPFVFLLLVQRRKKVLYGFFPIAAMLALVSTVIVGWEGMLQYPRYVLHLEQTMAQGAIMPSDMPNLRGVLYLLLPGDSHVAAVSIVLSVGVLVFVAWWCCAGANLFDLNFSLSAVATVLVSYHALGYDLSLLWLPILLLVNELLGESNIHRLPDFLTISAIAALFFSPLQLILLTRSNRLALMGSILVVWLFGIAGEISSHTTEGKRENAVRNI
ncbi:MAG: glycosyltransferase family 87 protein [Terriglobales bacterium]